MAGPKIGGKMSGKPGLKSTPFTKPIMRSPGGKR